MDQTTNQLIEKMIDRLMKIIVSSSHISINYCFVIIKSWLIKTLIRKTIKQLQSKKAQQDDGIKRAPALPQTVKTEEVFPQFFHLRQFFKMYVDGNTSSGTKAKK